MIAFEEKALSTAVFRFIDKNSGFKLIFYVEKKLKVENSGSGIARKIKRKRSCRRKGDLSVNKYVLTTYGIKKYLDRKFDLTDHKVSTKKKSSRFQYTWANNEI